MPTFEPKNIQKQLEDGKIWPVYWLVGPERLKSQELLKRIRAKVLAQAGESTDAQKVSEFSESRLDGESSDAASVIEAAQSQSLFGGPKLVVIRDAHLLKEPDEIETLLGQAVSRDELAYCVVGLAKELDGRRKISKRLTESAAVVRCDAVAETEREAWIKYLAGRRGIAPESLTGSLLQALVLLEPWNLEHVEQELEKLSHLDPKTLSESSQALELLGGVGAAQVSTERWVEAFLKRDRATVMGHLHTLSESPDETLPLLGLLGWNIRQLVVAISDPASARAQRAPWMQRLTSYTKYWKAHELIALHEELARMDFSLKQKPLLPLGLWQMLSRFI